MMLYTTLKAIRIHHPCEGGWEKLLKSLGKTKADDEVLSFEYILNSNGSDDAIWCLRAVDKFEKEIRLFNCDVAEHVLWCFEKEIPADKRPRNAINVSRAFANGKETQENLAAAWAAARAAAWDAACDAARDAAWAAASAAARAAARYAARDAARDAASAAARYAARDAAWDAARDAEKEWQRLLFIRYFCMEA